MHADAGIRTFVAARIRRGLGTGIGSGAVLRRSPETPDPRMRPRAPRPLSPYPRHTAVDRWSQPRRRMASASRLTATM